MTESEGRQRDALLSSCSKHNINDLLHVRKFYFFKFEAVVGLIKLVGCHNFTYWWETLFFQFISIRNPFNYLYSTSIKSKNLLKQKVHSSVTESLRLSVGLL